MQLFKSFFLFGVFKIKQWVEFNLIFFGIEKYDSLIKTKGIFSFLPQIKNSVTISVNFFITKDFSKHVIKYNQYSTLFVWIVAISIWVNIFFIARIFRKRFWIC